MQKYLKNERGSIIEMIIVLAIVILMITFLFTNMGKLIPSEARDAANKGFEEAQVAKEEPKVDTPTQVKNNEHDEKALKQFFIIAGSVLLSLLVILGTILMILSWREKQKRGPQNLDEMLRFMVRKKPKNLFTLIKGTVEIHTYQYSVLNYEWFLESTARELDIKMKRNDKQVLHITYNKKTEDYTRKNVKAHVFSDEKTLHLLDKLMESLVATEWNERLSFQLVSEGEELHQELPKESSIITNPIQELYAYIESIIEDLQTKEKFQAVVENMLVLQQFEDQLDVETKHLIEYSLMNDLNRLLSLYENLDAEQKESLTEAINARLDLMNEKVEQIKTKVNMKKEKEIKKALHLFDKRYQT